MSAPVTVDVDPDGIPDDLRERDVWVCWKIEMRDGEPTKIPVDAKTGDRASATDPATWTSFALARSTHDHGDTKTDGIGYVFAAGGPFVGIDLDNCRDPATEKIDEWARDVLDTLDTYAEVSPSGTGVHAFVRGDLPDGGNRRGDVEIYDDARFFTVTGEQVDGTPESINARQDALDAVHAEYVARDLETDPAEGDVRHENPGRKAGEPTSGDGFDGSDADLIEKAKDAEDGEKFADLWAGRWEGYGYPSHSEARMALLCKLAFWTGKDDRRMDSLFRDSGLHPHPSNPGKWDRVGDGEIAEAIAFTDDVYEPPRADGGTEAVAEAVDADGEPVAFHGPPEPIRTPPTDDAPEGDLKVVYPDPDGAGLTATPLTAYVCQLCGRRVDVDPGEALGDCPGCERNGPFKHALDGVDGLDSGEAQILTHAADTDLWRLPSGVDGDGYDNLWNDVRAYIRDHWDTDDPAVYDALTAFALSTWFRDQLDFLPHLMLMGKTTNGKTRLLNTLARVSYRAIVSASTTPAVLFRMIDRYGVTFYVSEYHGLNHEAREELDNVVRAGQKRGEVVARAEQTATGYEPTVFDPFTHLAIATQYEPADDVVNRCLQVHSQSADRDMPAKHDEDRATALRDRLLWARFRLLESLEWADAERKAYAYLADQEIDGRPREKLLALVTIAHIFDRVDAITPVVNMVVEQDSQAAVDSEDAVFVAAVRDLASEIAERTAVLGEPDGGPLAHVEIPMTDVVERFNAMTGADKSPQWAGHVRSRLKLGSKRKTSGIVIHDPDLDTKLRRHCEDLGLDYEERTEEGDPVKELSADNQYQGTCNECGERRMVTHEHVTEGYNMCERCADDLQAAVEERRAADSDEK